MYINFYISIFGNEYRAEQWEIQLLRKDIDHGANEWKLKYVIIIIKKKNKECAHRVSRESS